MAATDNTSSDRWEDRPDNLHPERLASLGLLVAGIAHNLNGPLTGVLGTIDLLKIKHPDIADDLDRVSRQGRQLQEMVRMMLHKARIESKGMVGEVNLRRVVDDALEFYKGDPRLKHMVEIELDAPEGLPTFRAVAGDFSYAFTNLLANAVEAMVDSDEKKLTITLAQEGDEILLKVRDTGEGMAPEVQERAFEPFFTTKQPAEGGKFPGTLATGLGLTQVKNLMDPVGVDVGIESTPGVGTEVTLRIPWREIDEGYREGRLA